MRIAATLIAVAVLGAAAAVPGVSNAAAPTVPKAPTAPSSVSPTNDTSAVKPSLKGCNQQADAKNLTGKDRATFVKDCEAGKLQPDS
jgi:hypothetical protein